ncbi:hypothetical protein FRC01_013699 [Tulasnella sp. 417]|nr:hypothetical protein FRC01_013699 [Tulasnella sp. 417]
MKPVGSSKGTKPPRGRPRKKISSVSKSAKPKTTIIGTAKTVRKPPSYGIDISQLPYPLKWKHVPSLGSPLPGPDPSYISSESFFEEAAPGVYDCVLAAIMSRKCKNPLEVTITIAEKQPWKIWKMQKQGPKASWTERLASTCSTVSHLISMARLPKDDEGYYAITNPSDHPLPRRRDKNKGEGKRATVQAVGPSQDFETEIPPTSTPSPNMSLYSSRSRLAHFSGAIGSSAPVFRSSPTSDADPSHSYFSEEAPIQDSLDRQDVPGTSWSSEQDELAYSMMLQNLLSSSAPSEAMASVGGFGYSQLNQPSDFFLGQDRYGEFITQSYAASLPGPNPSSIQPADPMDAAATAEVMVPPYHPSYLYPGDPYFSVPSICQPLGYTAGFDWGERITDLQSQELQDNLFSSWTHLY